MTSMGMSRANTKPDSFSLLWFGSRRARNRIPGSESGRRPRAQPPNGRVRLEAERMQRVPEPAIDELQERELRRRQNAAPRARLVQHRHEAWRRKMMLIHDLERPGGDFPRREHAVGEAKRLRIEGERLFRPSPAVGFGGWQPFRQQSKQPH